MQSFIAKSWFGAVFALAGIGIVVMAHLDPSGANAPMFVIEAAAGSFFFAGVSVLARAHGADFIARLLALPVVYLLAVPGLWILFAEGDIQCSVSASIGGLWQSQGASSLLCRSVFGFGGLLVLAIALVFTWNFFKAKRRH